MFWLILTLYLIFCLLVIAWVIRAELKSRKRYDEHWDEVSGRKRRQ